MKKSYLILFIVILSGLASFFACNDDTNEAAGPAYDPLKPVKLTTFYPDSGMFQEKVILNGENFGIDPDIIKVYFNSKLAPVIGSTGTRMYVQAPRLPGDTCNISVVVGTDSAVYTYQFRYKSSVTVTTIAGNGRDGYIDGNLSQTELRPRFLTVDKDGNIFVSSVATNRNYIARINEESNEMITLAQNFIGGVLATNPLTGVISGTTESIKGAFITLDPKNFWAPKIYTARWTNPDEVPPNNYNPANIVSPYDGMIYTHFALTGIMRINPNTWEAERILEVPGNVNGMVFRPNEPDILYMAFRGTSAYLPNTLVRLNVNNPDSTFERLNLITAAGHRDGTIEQAQFNDVRMMACDFEGNIYMADNNNHCIRRLTTDNMVETVLGIPGIPGWKDGGKSEALFRNPSGIGVSADGTVYVADELNFRVRKLSIN